MQIWKIIIEINGRRFVSEGAFTQNAKGREELGKAILASLGYETTEVDVYWKTLDQLEKEIADELKERYAG